MNKDKAEEKAREVLKLHFGSHYANLYAQGDLPNIINAMIEFASTENAELREALRDLVIGIESLPPLRAIEGVLEKQYTQAKQLLTDNTQEK